MEKYVIDLDKVLDELELRDNDETSDQYNETILPSYNQIANSSLQNYSGFQGTSILNSYDKIDVRDADFSIQSKPPKILNSIAILDSVNIIEQHNAPLYFNNVPFDEPIIIENENNIECDPKLSESVSVLKNDHEDHSFISDEEVIKESVLSLQVELPTVNVIENLPAHCNTINDEGDFHDESNCDTNQLISPVIENNSKEGDMNLDLNSNLNSNLIDTDSSENFAHDDSVEIEVHSQNKLQGELEFNNLENPICDNAISDESVGLLDSDNVECNDATSLLVEEKINNVIVEQSSNQIVQNPTEDDCQSDRPCDDHPDKKSVIADQKELAVPCVATDLNGANEMNQIDIDNMLEEDLDKFLSDLEQNNCLDDDNNKNDSNYEILTDHSENCSNQTTSQTTGNEIILENISVEENLKKGDEITNDEQYISEPINLLNYEPNAIISIPSAQSAAINNQFTFQNEADFVNVEPSRPQSLTLQNVTNDEQIGQSQQTSSLNNNDPANLGGLVQNIAYFERQEMPNGLTEEEQMLGKVKPFWIPDEEAQNCLHCDAKFTMIKRRHHCRSCGKVLCSQCCNYKAKIMYLENKEARVCQLCYAILMRIEEIEKVNGHPIDISDMEQSSNTTNNPLTINFPDPNNPAEYCSTISPFEQVPEAQTRPPPTVMVPVGVLKRPGSNAFRRGGNSSDSMSGERSQETVKQVMFSDGVRPGGDLVESPTTSKLPEERPIGRTQLQLKSPPVEKPFLPIEQTSKRLKPSRLIVVDSNGVNLPPILNYNELKTIDPSLPSKPTYSQLLDCLRSKHIPYITFGLTKNLFVNAKLIQKLCCNSIECWTFASRGLATVGQDEVFFCLDCNSLNKPLSNDDNNKEQIVTDSTLSISNSSDELLDFPRDVFRLFTAIYDSASKASLYTELSHIFFPDGLFGNKENSGFIFTQPTLQCFQNVLLPSPPHLIAILIHKWEIPWAKVFPLRLALRLGYEYKMYPSPVISFANRKPVYFEIGHTIMNVLADFRNFQYTLSVVKDLVIHIEERKRVSLLIPKLSYEKVCKVLSTSNEHVLAFGGNFSLKADSHFACIQNEEDDDVHGQYHTQMSHFPSSPLKISAASFIVFSGALKSSTGLKAKMNIVEDGILVQIPSSTMEELRAAIRDMKEFKIDCCKVNETNSPDEWVQINWVNDELSTNLGVRSQIDGLNLEGIQSARIFSSPDYTNERYLIRWIEVFLLQINENSRRSEMLNTSRLAESVSQAFCVALIDFLDQLYESGLTKIGLRVSLDVDKVGYEAGSGGEQLPPQFTVQLDSALIPAIMENTSTTGIEDPLVIELLFYILLK